MSTLPPVPHSEEAERAVLASVLLKPEVLDEIEISTTDFYLERHQVIFEAMVELAADRQPVDLRTLQAQLEQRGAFQQIGGHAYLAGMDLDLPDLGRVETYAGIVRERAGRRRLLEAAQRLAQEAYGGGELTAGELAARFGRELEELEDSGGVDSRVWASDLVGGVLEDAAERRRQREETGEAVLGLKTSIPRLDGLLCGLQRGLYLLAGPPGMGKTSLALQMALEAAREVPVVFVTYENTGASLLQKALCARAGLPIRDVTRGYADLEKLRVAAEELKPVMERLVLIDGDSRLTVGRLRARARRALEVRRAQRCLVVIDYLQLWAKVSRELRELTDVRSKVDTLGGELISLARRLDS
ncbi:MAG: AAA family ATPase, partial [bacterium]|nr:AAA family ATPase [bacterium]